MIKKPKFKLLLLSVLLPALLVANSTIAFANDRQSILIEEITKEEVISSKNKIEEKNGIITINGEKVHYIPDSKIKIGSDSANTDIGFVKPEELSSEEIVCQLFPEGSPHPTDVRQGQLDACVFFAALSGLAESNSDFIKENLIEYNNDFVIVKFFCYDIDVPIYVMVQKTIPNLLENEGAFLNNNCLWVHMYLKAFAAMEIVITKTDSLDYKNASYARPLSMLWIPDMLTGKATDLGLPWQMQEEDLYEKIKKTLETQGIIICDFSDNLLCWIPFFKYFITEIEYKGLVAYHEYSVTRVYEDVNGTKWVRCRNPWGHFVPAYDRDGKLYANKYNNTTGYFWLKLKDFHKNCHRIYFSTEKNISDNAACK